MQKVILNIAGMTCSACQASLEKYLNKQPGIITASVNLVLGQALIEYDDTLTINDLNKFVKESGFESLGIYDPKKEEKGKNNNKVILFIFTILSITLLYISMADMLNLPVIPYLDMAKYPENYSICLLILTIPYLIYGFDIFKNGYKNLLHKAPNMDTLVSIGVLSSLIYSVIGVILILNKRVEFTEQLYFESVCIVIYFIKLGRFIDLKSKEKTSEAIKELVQITPQVALIKTDDGDKEITIDEVKVGDILICKPGMKIAVDGVITSGSSHMDEAFITGEAVKVKKEIGSNVIAGSLNIDGYIEYKALKIGSQTTISEIVKLVVEATNTKAPIAKLADKVCGYFTPSIMLIATLTFIAYLLMGVNLNTALTHFITVLTVACPCALGLATPLAIVVGEGICARLGILVKSSEILENAHKVDTIVFDKTGTLTYGNLNIAKVFNYSSYSDNKIIQLTSSIEQKSTHPIAKAFIDYAKQNNLSLISVTNFLNLAGIGLKANIDKNTYYIGNDKILDQLNIKNTHTTDEHKLKSEKNSIVYVIENNKIIALIGVKDTVRSNSKHVVEELKKMHKKVIMLTGDNEATANAIAKELGINETIANVLPKDKLDKINELKKTNKRIMMVGDGINDAPSLVSADIGVSLAGGTDIAGDSADVILMNDNLINLLNLLEISLKTVKNIKQNLFWAFFYNIVMIPVAMGLFNRIGVNMNPMFAGISMTISSLTVVFNALRLKNIKLRRDKHV